MLMAAAIAALFGVGAIAFRWKRKDVEDKKAVESATQPASDRPGSTIFAALRRTRERLRAFWGEADGNDPLQLLEEALVGADVGSEMAHQVVERLRAAGETGRDEHTLRKALAAELVRIFEGGMEPVRQKPQPGELKAIVMVGVNGVGKTTSVAKLAWWLRSQGLRVLLIAADTFRAAAGEQLETWAKRLGIGCIRHQAGADPGAVVFDGLQAARARGMDVVIVDTAGRLHSKQNLVEELRKIVRITQKQVGEKNVEVLLVIDATNGQNAVVQARVLSEALPVSGVCLTKLDGTAKGGVAIPIAAKLKLPIRFVGFGEGLSDWQEFDAHAFVAALLGEEEREAPSVVQSKVKSSNSASLPA